MDIDRLVPGVIKERGGQDLERARLVVWFVLGLLVAGLGLAPVMALAYESWTGALLLLGIEIGLLSAVLAIQHASGSSRYAGLLLCGQLLVLLTYIGMRTPWLDTATVVVFPAVPLIAIFTAGYRRGRYMAVLACTVLIGFLGLHLGDFHPATPDHFVTFFVVALAVVLTTALAAAYDRARATADSRLEETLDELRRTNRELARARDASETASRAKSEFLARMSHEIRTPIHGVLGMNELMLESDLDEEQREYVTAIRQSAKALISVVEDVLDFSRLEAGKATTRQVEYEPRKIVESATGVVAQGAGKKGLELTVLVDPQVPHSLPGDPDRVRQVLVNLLSNAVKYTESGEIALRCRIEADRPGAVVVFSVRDTGVGLASDKLESIFEPFTQVDSFITRPQPGSGLGLAICRQLVQLMNGSIEVKSEIGKGSVFSFTLPVPGIHPHEPAQPLRGRRALCVDDNASANEVPATLLDAWGMDVVRASDGEQALVLMAGAAERQVAFDMAILDCRMPGMDGLGIAGRMAERPDLASVPVVLVMPFGQSIEIGHLRGLTTTRISKPIQERALLHTLQGLLGGRQVEEMDFRAVVSGPMRLVGPVPGQEGRVLIVDDNAIGRDLASRIVRRLGHEVTSTEDGRKAVDLASAGRFDLILMDCQMPGMDGYEAAQEIRRREGSGRRTPIVAMTAHAMGDERQRCLDVGMDDYLAKPFLPRQLALIVSRWMRPGG